MKPFATTVQLRYNAVMGHRPIRPQPAPGNPVTEWVIPLSTRLHLATQMVLQRPLAAFRPRLPVLIVVLIGLLLSSAAVSYLFDGSLVRTWAFTALLLAYLVIPICVLTALPVLFIALRFSRVSVFEDAVSLGCLHLDNEPTSWRLSVRGNQHLMHIRMGRREFGLAVPRDLHASLATLAARRDLRGHGPDAGQTA